jgi:hypothetical protein
MNCPGSSFLTPSGTRCPRTSTAPSSTATRVRAAARSITKRVPVTSTFARPHSMIQRLEPPGLTWNATLPDTSSAEYTALEFSSGSSEAPGDSVITEPSESSTTLGAASPARTASAPSSLPSTSRSGPGSARGPRVQTSTAKLTETASAAKASQSVSLSDERARAGCLRAETPRQMRCTAASSSRSSSALRTGLGSSVMRPPARAPRGA